MDKYGKTPNSKFIFELDNILCGTVIKDSYNRTSINLIGHNNLMVHNKSKRISINIACSTFNASSSLSDIQPDQTVSDTDISEGKRERKHIWLQPCGFRNTGNIIHCILCLNQYLNMEAWQTTILHLTTAIVQGQLKLYGQLKVLKRTLNTKKK